MRARMRAHNVWPRVVFATLGIFMAGQLCQAQSGAAETDPHANAGSPTGAHGSADPHLALTPDQHLEVARQHSEAGRATLAVEALNDALARFPDHAALLGSRAGIYLERGETARALVDLEKAIEVSPDSPSLLVSRATAYQRFERSKAAMADLDRAIAIDADYLPALFNRGAMLLAAGEVEASIADFERCISIDPHLPAPWFNRAAAYHEMGDSGAAIEDLKRFLQISDNESWNEVARNLLAEWGAVEVPATIRSNTDS